MGSSRPYYQDDAVTLLNGEAYDVLSAMTTSSINCIVSSPPYWSVRDYGGEAGQLGLEPTSAEYIARLTSILAEAHRVLADDGTLWLNLGDTYAGKADASAGMSRRADRSNVIPPRINATAEAPYKSLLMIPERVAWAMIQSGWILRNRIVWNKPNAMPESVTDRFSCRHEALFLFVKQPRYWFDLDPIREVLRRPEALDEGIVFGGKKGAEGKVGGSARRSGGDRSVYGARVEDRLTHPAGRNPGDGWDVATARFPGAHFAVMPDELVRRAILAGCHPGGTVLDPFAGSCTTGLVAGRLGRRFTGIELHQPYLDLALRTRLAQGALVAGRD